MEREGVLFEVSLMLCRREDSEYNAGIQGHEG